MQEHTAMAGGPGKAAPTKLLTMLLLLLSGRSLNRFEAERHHDHCLHSTVASIEGYGVKVARIWERVPCLHGRATTRCKRYWLARDADNVLAARALAAQLGGRP